ncbi:MAG: hypothetical protein K6G29_14245 [Clostridiales bacterium]|nr:hypothetical protein [Clostridiales bacterium]
MKSGTGKKRIMLLLLAFFALFCSCGKKTASPGDDAAEDTAGERFCFSQQKVAVGEGDVMLPYILPAADGERISVLFVNLQDAAEGWENASVSIRELSYEGELLSETTLSLPGEAAFPDHGILTSDALYTTDESRDQCVIHRIDRASGQITHTQEIGSMLSSPLAHLTADAAGTIYCTDGTTLVAMDSSLAVQFTTEFRSPILSMAPGSDGSVWAYAGDKNGCYAMRIEERRIGDPVFFARSSHSPRSLLASAGGEYLFLCCDGEGIWGVHEGETGKLYEDKLLDLDASGIRELCGRLDFLGSCAGFYPALMLRDDLLLAAEFDGGRNASPLLCARTDRTEYIPTLTVAVTMPLLPGAVSALRDYNRDHPEMNIQVADYSDATTEEDPYGGEAKLCFDMANNGFRPDMIFTATPRISLSERSAARYLTSRRLYLDLAPLLAADDTVNTDSLFGCVPRMFDDGEGGMWGITTNFYVQTLVANPTYLSEDCRAKGTWSLDEFLDCVEALPPGVDVMFRQTRQSGFLPYLKDGFGPFVRDGNASFDSDLFIRFMKYMKSVPADFEEWKRVTAIDEATFEQDAFRSGKLLFRMEYTFSWQNYYEIKAVWEEEDSGGGVPIGYPAEDGSGTRFFADNLWMITSFTEYPDVCFDFLKTLFMPEPYRNSARPIPIFAWKPALEKMAEEEDAQPLADTMGEEYYDRLIRLFDEGGSPILGITPEPVLDIVMEEASAYYAGIGSPEDCAKKIQSRVSIWLAEHH